MLHWVISNFLRGLMFRFASKFDPDSDSRLSPSSLPLSCLVI